MTVADHPATPTIAITELTHDLIAPAAALLAVYLWPNSEPAADRAICEQNLLRLAGFGRQQGANRLQLETDTENAPARSLYSAYGFEWLPDKEVYMLFL